MINLKSNLVMIICIALSFFSQTGEANNSKKDKAPRVEMKCYVELAGGINTIYRTVLPNNMLEGMTKRLIGKKISVAGAKRKQKIYKVIECVGYKDIFINAKAQLIEKNTAG